MGYTHYFKQNKQVSDEQWDSFKKDADIVLNHIQKALNIVLMSDDPDGIIINNDRVNLNGDATCDLDHEIFYLTKNYRDFNFCKTAYKPYDLAVCSLLLLSNEHMPNHHEIGSDGGFEDWKEAMELNAKLLQRGFKLPSSIESSDEISAFEDELSAKYVKLNTVQTEEKQDIFTDKKKNSRFNL